MRENAFTARGSRVWAALFVVGMMAASGCGGSTEPLIEPPPPPPPLEELRLEALTPTSLTGVVGLSVDPVPRVRVTNVNGIPKSGITVNFETTGGGRLFRSTGQTDGNGVTSVWTWTLGNVAGVQTLTARADAMTAVTFTATAEHGPIAAITAISGNYQSAQAGDALAVPLRVRVADQFDNPVGGASLKFSVITGGGEIAGDVAETDSLGMATSGTWTLGAYLGPQHVRVHSWPVHVIFTALGCGIDCEQPELLYVRDGKVFSTTLLGSARRLTSDDNAFDAAPVWSPDGRRIAFVRFSGAGIAVGDVYVMDADGSNVARVAVGFGSPAWSPDGRRLAMTGSNNNDCYYQCEVYTLVVDDPRATPVFVASSAAQPAWSPDGTKIAFVSLSGNDGYHALYVMKADGSEVTPITSRTWEDIDHPTWSPDGTHIAFSSCGMACVITIVDVTGQGMSEPVLKLWNVTGLGPTWSPDGRWIAFTHDVAGQSVAYISVDGGYPIPLVQAGSNPAWRPSRR